MREWYRICYMYVVIVPFKSCFNYVKKWHVIIFLLFFAFTSAFCSQSRCSGPASVSCDTFITCMCIVIADNAVYLGTHCNIGLKSVTLSGRAVGRLTLHGGHPTWGRGTPFLPFSSLVYSLPHLLLFFPFSLFPFLVRFAYSLLSSTPSLSCRIVTTPFPGRRS